MAVSGIPTISTTVPATPVRTMSAILKDRCDSPILFPGSGGDNGGGDNGSGDSGNTGGVPRPKFGSVAYGVNIATCTVPGTIAITYDDGPFTYTAQLLDILARYNASSTFFINGLNWGDTRQYGGVLRRMVAEGHQIASHTYGHPDLNTIDSAARRQQMFSLEAIFKDFFGYFPTYMRPPFGSCNGACLTDMADLGYHVIMWNIDTLDYANQSPTAIQTSMDIFDGAVSTDASRNAYISLEHDVHPYTVSHLTEHILQTAQSRGYRLVTVGECLGDPSGNWYRDAVTGNAVGGSTTDGGDNGGGETSGEGDNNGGDGGDEGSGGDNGGDDGGNGNATVSPDGSCGVEIQMAIAEGVAKPASGVATRHVWEYEARGYEEEDIL
ncbi:hypothetical protein OQA88_11579 [Cercophora sp. LCS_1]